MNYFLIVLFATGITIQNYAKKEYVLKNGKNKISMPLYNAIMSLVSFMVFIFLTIGNFTLHVPTLVYALLNGLFFALNIYANLQAMKHGSLVLTALINSYALVIPSVYGLVFLNEKVALPAYIGLFLLAISLYLINKQSKNNIKITLKWGLFALINFVANGICSTILKVHQTNFSGMYKLEYLTIVMAISTITCIVFLWGFSGKEIVKTIKIGWILPVIAAFFNVVNNIALLSLAARMPAAIMFPLMAGSNTLFTFLLSKLIFKERLSKSQKFGFAFGTTAVILLSI